MMNFSKEFFVNNRKRLAEMHPNSLILISANRPMQRSGDSTYPFKQDGNFWYLTGINKPNLILVIDTNDNTELIALPTLSEPELIFEGEPDLKEYEEISGIKWFISQEQGLKKIAELKDYDKVYMNLAKKRPEIVINSMRKALQETIKGHVKSLSDIRPSTDKLRMIKQPIEIEAIKKATAITKEALSLAAQAIKEGVYSEKQLEAVINVHFAKQYVINSFEPIIASGKNGLTIHYINNNQAFGKDSHTVLFDIGAEYNNYCADVARTFVLNNNEKAEKLTCAVLSVQKEIIKFLKPGITWKQYHKFAEASLVKHLSKAGEKVNEENIRKYFPHSIGHFLGIDVHDTGDYRQPLAENMVITVEPGYYNPSNGFGIRVEDAVLITSSGAEVL
ncbi:aminopeptidase P N-terminal domain-containing protein [Candidatus Saccharibacteria bacterium]|nr:aminopeptidase P N-terminal domain-containing protein [Candidatus Saccharibacteria bacterium]MBP7834845.1 aminopeptidase P N-terminal domain-containing protein [Candidatus Saccharibacteria bacterium]